jgi:hypothetical protein
VNSAGAQIPIYDPTTQVTSGGVTTRTRFAGNKIPVSLFNPASIQALKVFQGSGVLAPNTGAVPGTVGYVTNNYIIANGSQVTPVNKISIKGDHLFNEKHRISGYYGGPALIRAETPSHRSCWGMRILDRSTRHDLLASSLATLPGLRRTIGG